MRPWRFIVAYLCVGALIGFGAMTHQNFAPSHVLAQMQALPAVECSARNQTGQPDPLPSWKTGPAKTAILDFVAGAIKEGGADFIPIADRIATFDNDGTLWCEKPTVEIEFTRERIKAMAAQDPTLKDKQPYKAALDGDQEHFHKAGMKAVLELVTATHGDMPQDQFDKEARDFFKTARHPKFDQLYPKMTYQPMTELLRYLRANGFQTWICSGGFSDLMRTFALDAYGIPPQQVIGSSMKKKSMEKDGKRMLFLLSQLLCVCDQDDKPVEIGLHIGKRPVFAAGNVRTGGDIAMLQYCQGSKYKSLQLIINHDDATREYAYAEANRASLNAAEKYRWNIVSMNDDWQRVFAFEK